MPDTQSIRLPDFLIIGSMKAGTSTLYQDLESQPSVYMPYRKEPNNLLDPHVLAAPGKQAYARLFSDASDEQLCGEASTSYTKRPTHEGVSERARQLLGQGLKLIFIARNPIDRAVSHHYHLYLRREAPRSVDAFLRENQGPLEYSRYAMQLEPWLAAFGRDSLHLVRFEDFVAGRGETLQSVCSFLGFEVDESAFDFGRSKNVSATKRQVPAWLRGVGQTSLTKNLRRVLPTGLYTSMRNAVSYRRPKPEPLSSETAEFLRGRLESDQRRFEQMFDLPEPWWDLEETVAKYAAAKVS